MQSICDKHRVKNKLDKTFIQINSYRKAYLHKAVVNHGALIENPKQNQATDFEIWCFIFLRKTTTTN